MQLRGPRARDGQGHEYYKDSDLNGATQEDLDRMAREGFVKPIIGKTYGFDEVPQALKDIDERRALGKLVLVPG